MNVQLSIFRLIGAKMIFSGPLGKCPSESEGHDLKMITSPESLTLGIRIMTKICGHLRNYPKFNFDGFVKSPQCPLFVIPAKAGIQSFQIIMDSRFRGNDSILDFSRFHQASAITFCPLNPERPSRAHE